jgi:hypothetical protein
MKCQEVDTVSKLILLGVPNSIEEDVIKDTLDKVLVDLESMLLQTDSEYKLTKDQHQNWIKYTVTREFPPGMPWEDAEERRRSRETTMPGLHTYCRCINLTTSELATYAVWQNNASCGLNIGAIGHSQSRSQIMIANKGRRHDTFRWSRPTVRYS